MGYELYNTSDKLISEILFKLKYNSVDSIKFISRCLTQGSIVPLRFVARYLVDNIADAMEAKRLLDKYIVVILYTSLKSKNDKLLDGLNSKYLDEIYDNGLTIDKLKQELSDDNLFHKLIRLEANFGKTKDKLFDRLKENSIEAGYTSNDYLDNMKLILCYRMNFFSSNTAFKFYDKMKRSNDLLIAEARSYNKKREFSFDIPMDNGNYDEFLKNILEYEKINGTSKDKKEARKNINDAKVLLAHLVNDSITNNTSLNEIHTISSSELKGYELNYEARLINKKLGDKPILNFLVNCDEYYYPDLDKINSFKVIYNNELYLISKNGIEKI